MAWEEAELVAGTGDSDNILSCLLLCTLVHLNAFHSSLTLDSLFQMKHTRKQRVEEL